jgi:outer membrane protein, heavy metal efflux system
MHLRMPLVALGLALSTLSLLGCGATLDQGANAPVGDRLAPPPFEPGSAPEPTVDLSNAVALARTSPTLRALSSCDACAQQALIGFAAPGDPATLAANGTDKPEREWSGEAVSLAQVLEHAREHSPSITRSEARVAFGTAQVEGAKPLLPENPVVSAALGARVNPLGSSFESQLQVWQPFEIAGERRQRLAAGRAAEDAWRAEVDEIWWETEVEIRAAFAYAVVAREAAEAQANAVAFAERMMTAFELSVSVGDLAPLNLRIAEIDVADARQQQFQLELEYQNACVRLATLAGWPAGKGIEPIGGLPGPVAIDELDIDELVDEHPAVLSAEADLEAAESRLNAANRDAWPHPALGAYAAYEQEPGTPFASNVGLVTLTIPIPMWQRNQDRRAEARAGVTVAKADNSALKYELSQLIEARLNAVRTAARRVETYSEEMLPRFSENLRMLERAFELGEIDIL